MSQQWQKKKLYQSQKLHQLRRVSVVCELVLFKLCLLITIEEFPSAICVQSTVALRSGLGISTTGESLVDGSDAVRLCVQPKTTCQ